MYDKIKEQILLKIQSKKEEPFILAIDGRCASGKTTLAKIIANTTKSNFPPWELQ